MCAFHTQMKAPTLTHRQLATLGLQLEACRGLQRLNYFLGANGSSFRLARACTPQYPTNTGVGQIQMEGVQQRRVIQTGERLEKRIMQNSAYPCQAALKCFDP